MAGAGHLGVQLREVAERQHERDEEEEARQHRRARREQAANQRAADAPQPLRGEPGRADQAVKLGRVRAEATLVCQLEAAAVKPSEETAVRVQIPHERDGEP